MGAETKTATCEVAAQDAEADVDRQPHHTPPEPKAASLAFTPDPEVFSRPATCRLCGQAVGGRDFAAVYPWDSECGCGTPFGPAPIEEILPAANEVWFRQNVELIGLIRAPIPAENRPRLTVVKKSPPAEPAERRTATRARTVSLA